MKLNKNNERFFLELSLSQKMMYDYNSNNNSRTYNLTHIDMAGDLIAGLLLAQIYYWHLPSKNGKMKSKLQLWYKGRLGLAKNRTEWYDEIRITPKQYDKAIKILKDKEFVTVNNTMFDGKRTPVIQLNLNKYMEEFTKVINLNTPQNIIKEFNNYSLTEPIDFTGSSQIGNTANYQSGTPLTETTSEKYIYIEQPETNVPVNSDININSSADALKSSTVDSNISIVNESEDKIETHYNQIEDFIDDAKEAGINVEDNLVNNALVYFHVMHYERTNQNVYKFNSGYWNKIKNNLNDLAGEENVDIERFISSFFNNKKRQYFNISDCFGNKRFAVLREKYFDSCDEFESDQDEYDDSMIYDI